MDEIIRVIAKDAPVKAMAITARDTVERARAIHDCWPVASAALGRLLGSGLISSSTRLCLLCKFKGPAGRLQALLTPGIFISRTENLFISHLKNSSIFSSDVGVFNMDKSQGNDIFFISILCGQRIRYSKM